MPPARRPLTGSLTSGWAPFTVHDAAAALPGCGTRRPRSERSLCPAPEAVQLSPADAPALAQEASPWLCRGAETATFPETVGRGIVRGPRPRIQLMPANPDWIYRQSAVVPYLWREDELHVVLVTSARSRRWGIPKGIVDPGLSPAQSAAKEAKERIAMS